MNSLFLSRFFCRPKILVFFVSFNCNLRCAMCSAWVKKKQINDPTLAQIGVAFNDKVLKGSIEVVNITGGEPTLRKDLPEIVKIILKNCLRLKRLDISTNGVDTAQVLDQIERVLALLLPTESKLGVSISLDGIGNIHEQVRNVEGIFGRIEQTIYGLKELMPLYPGFTLGLNMTISKLNCGAMGEVKSYAKSKGLGVSFTISALSDIGVESIRVRDRFEMNQEEKSNVVPFIEKLAGQNEIDKRYADFLKEWLMTGRRRGSCAFRQGKSLLLEPSGDVYLCGNFKDFRIGNIFLEPFVKMRKRIGGFSKRFPEKCFKCVSNCYIQEAVN